MPFADGAKTQDESTAILWRAGLVGVPDDAGIEQGRRFERVLVKKIRSNQAASRLIQYGMRLQRLFHLGGARFEDLEQVPVTTFEIFEHLCQLSRGGLGIEPKNPGDDMVGPSLVGWVEVSGLSRWLEGSDDDPGRIRAQMQVLAIEKLGLGQRGPLGLPAVRSSERRCVSSWTAVSFGLSQ
jgi:hypothetical protein